MRTDTEGHSPCKIVAYSPAYTAVYSMNNPFLSLSWGKSITCSSVHHMSHFEELRYGPGMMLHGLYPEVSQGSSVPLSVKDKDLRVMVSILLATEIESFMPVSIIYMRATFH